MKHIHQIRRLESGFTLIEIMVVVSILAILSAIAIPSYRHYVVRNAEQQAKSEMKQLEMELERWRATALTYNGFAPKKINNSGVVSYSYDESDNTTIYVPSNSTASNYRYKITLANTGGSTLMVSDTFSDSTARAGNAWRMLAEPNSNGITSSAHTIMMDSTGLQCQSKDNSVTITSNNCGTGSEAW